MTIVRRVMALPTPPAQRVESLGLDDFAFRHGRTFSTVIVDLDAHQIIDLLPDRQAETAAAWMAAYPETTHVSRDRAAEYASAVSEPGYASYSLYHPGAGNHLECSSAFNT